MAFYMGLAGNGNTGKSFSRRFIKGGEKVFIISPNSKSNHLKSSDGKPLKRLNFSTEKVENVYEAAKALKTKSLDRVFKFGLKKADSGASVKFTGNYITTDIYNIGTYLDIIDKYMPEITVVIISDFTHYISKIISSDDFRSRNKGNEAFQRYTDLAGDALQNVIIKIDSLFRENLCIITEYHVEYDENEGEWRLFVPGGKMLSNTFKLDTYYDYLLFTHVEKTPEGEVTPESYKFVTERWKNYPARFQQLFNGELIPNNLELVLKKLEEDKGVKLF